VFFSEHSVYISKNCPLYPRSILTKPICNTQQNLHSSFTQWT